MAKDRVPRNTSQLRAAINRGETGDKVAMSDPAAAPLGTDDEAAGAPPSEAAVTRAARRELFAPGPRPGSPPGSEGGAAPPHRSPRDAGWIAGLAALVLVAVAALAALLVAAAT